MTATLYMQTDNTASDKDDHVSCSYWLQLTRWPSKRPLEIRWHSADFSMAFDRVLHQRLLHKLPFYGVRRNTWNWEKDLLAKRTQQVTLEGQSSTRADVISAVSSGRWWNHYYFSSLSTFIRCETHRWWLPVLLKNQLHSRCRATPASSEVI